MSRLPMEAWAEGRGGRGIGGQKKRSRLEFSGTGVRVKVVREGKKGRNNKKKEGNLSPPAPA